MNDKTYDLFCGKLVAIDNVEEMNALLVELTSINKRINFNPSDAIKDATQVLKGKKITFISFSYVYGMPVIAFFHHKAKGKRNGKQIHYAYVYNCYDSEYSEYGSVYIQNINGEDYYLP